MSIKNAFSELSYGARVCRSGQETPEAATGYLLAAAVFNKSEWAAEAKYIWMDGTVSFDRDHCRDRVQLGDLTGGMKAAINKCRKDWNRGGRIDWKQWAAKPKPALADLTGESYEESLESLKESMGGQRGDLEHFKFMGGPASESAPETVIDIGAKLFGDKWAGDKTEAPRPAETAMANKWFDPEGYTCNVRDERSVHLADVWTSINNKRCWVEHVRSLRACSRGRFTVNGIVCHLYGGGLIGAERRGAGFLDCLERCNQAAAVFARIHKANLHQAILFDAGAAAAVWADLKGHGRGKAEQAIAPYLAREAAYAALGGELRRPEPEPEPEPVIEVVKTPSCPSPVIFNPGRPAAIEPGAVNVPLRPAAAVTGAAPAFEDIRPAAYAPPPPASSFEVRRVPRRFEGRPRHLRRSIPVRARA